MSDLGDILSRGGATVTGEVNAEETVETKESVEVVIPEKIPETKPVETGSTFDLVGEFNKKFSKEFDESTLTSIVEKGSRYDDTEKSYLDLQDKYAKLSQDLSARTDPMQWFASEDEFVRNQLLKTKGDQFSSDALDVIKKLSPSSIDKLNPLEALKTEMLISNPELEGGMDAVAELLLDKYGIEDDKWDDFDLKTKNRIKLDAKTAKANLKGLYADIKIPEKVDFNESRTQLEQTWKDPLKLTVEGLDKIQLAEGLDFTVTSEMKAGLEDELMGDILGGWLKPNKETAEAVIGKAREMLLIRNLDKVIDHISKTKDAEIKEIYRAKYENREPLNPNVSVGETNQNDAAINNLINK